MILVIDNYDSFTWNLVQALWSLGQSIKVVRNDELSLREIEALGAKGIVVSPGPCAPAQAGISVGVIRHFAPALPILGVCLGHQSLGAAFGAVIERAPLPVHGKTAAIAHAGDGVFRGLPSPLPATRYHSLVVREEGLPPALEVTARAEGLIMGLKLKDRPVFGVQFHPESIMTPDGPALLKNFVEYCR